MSTQSDINNGLLPSKKKHAQCRSEYSKDYEIPSDTDEEVQSIEPQELLDCLSSELKAKPVHSKRADSRVYSCKSESMGIAVDNG